MKKKSRPKQPGSAFIDALVAREAHMGMKALSKRLGRIERPMHAWQDCTRIVVVKPGRAA